MRVMCENLLGRAFFDRSTNAIAIKTLHKVSCNSALNLISILQPAYFVSIR